MSIEDDQTKTDVVKLIVQNKLIKLDDSFRDSGTPMFIKYCQNTTLKRFHKKGSDIILNAFTIEVYRIFLLFY